MHRTRGFTLIELMIVVAIIAILAAIAIPAYMDYAVRAKFTEAYSLAMSVRNAVGSAYNTGGMDEVARVANDYPANNTSTGSKYVHYIAVDDQGVITMAMRADADNGIPSDLDGKTMTLTPQIHTSGGYQVLANDLRGSMDWACASKSHTVADNRNMHYTAASMPAKYLPSECR